MNVAFEPWIPVVTLAGKPKLVSLEGIFTEGHQLFDLAVRPHERVALMRLFLCVAHAAINGPKDYDEWNAVPEKLSQSSQRYLSEWESSFELFDKKKPWLQVPDLEVYGLKKEQEVENEWSMLATINFTRASGNNSTLFDHLSNNGEITSDSTTTALPKDIALNLLTFQNYFVAGGQAPRKRKWGDIEMTASSYPKGGPCSGKSILYTFLRGTNVFDTIHLNLCTYDDLKIVYGDTLNWLGKPLWEMPIKNPTDEKSIENATKTHIGRLVPQTRILRVNSDCKRVLLGSGFDYPKFQEKKNPFYPDIFATTITNREQERELLSAHPGKSLWRELHSLSICKKDKSSLSRGPLCLLNLQEEQDCDIVSSAMTTNPKQAAEIIEIIESVFHIPYKLRSEEGNVAYHSEVEKSEALRVRLGGAIEIYRREIDDSWENRLRTTQDKSGLKSKLHTKSNHFYWTTVEKNLHLLTTHIEAVGTDKAISTRETWRKMLFRAACDAFQVTCGQETPRQIRAFIKGWGKLTNNSNANTVQTEEVVA